jgi:biopolymer transport protein ExbB/TolQ
MWDWLIWGALIAAGLATIGALALLVVRILQAWRDFKRSRRHLVRALDRVSESAERAARKAEAAGDTRELQQSVARLRRSLAQLDVLRAAADEAQATLGRFTGLVPRK